MAVRVPSGSVPAREASLCVAARKAQSDSQRGLLHADRANSDREIDQDDLA